jgi:hypothetical protein
VVTRKNKTSKPTPASFRLIIHVWREIGMTNIKTGGAARFSKSIARAKGQDFQPKPRILICATSQSGSTQSARLVGRQRDFSLGRKKGRD